MKSRLPKLIFVVSTLLTCGATVAWFSSQSEQPRSDLAGATVTRSATKSSSSARPGRKADESAKKSAKSQAVVAKSPSSTVPAAQPGLPTRIVIPKLGVNAPVVSVGLNADRSMEVPGATEAGWYDRGPLPGASSGSAVIAGHVDYKDAPGVFLELRRLEVGEVIDVVDTAGYRHGFSVTERFQVNKELLPTGELFRRSGPATLTLITCGGEFDSSNRSYDDNIVIRAIPLYSRAERPEAAVEALTARLLSDSAR